MRILFVAQAVVPCQVIGSIRWAKIFYYLKCKHDVKIDVLTNAKNSPDNEIVLYKEDSTLIKHKNDYENFYEAPFSNAFLSLNRVKTRKKANRIKQYHGEAMSKPTNAMVVENRHLSEWRRIKKDFSREVNNILLYKMVKREIEKIEDDYDLIISTYSPFWTHKIARQVKKRTNAKWIADFRDPCARKSTDSNLFYLLHKGFVRRNCADADTFLVVDDSLHLFFDGNIPKYTITNGYDPEDVTECHTPSKLDKFRIIYTGVLYEARDLSPLFRAVRELLEEQMVSPEDISIEYAGASERRFYHYASSENMMTYAHSHGSVSRTESLRLQGDAAILLQAMWNTKDEKAAWTGKSYEYMLSGKPTVYLVSGEVPYSKPYLDIKKIGGVCYEEARDNETMTEMKLYILEKYREWKETGNVSLARDEKYVRAFSYPEIAENVWSIIGKVMPLAGGNQ